MADKTTTNGTDGRAPRGASLQPQYEDDTISLIDLLAVVVRHRRLIIIGTLCVGIVTAAVLYLGPLAGLEAGPQYRYTAERQVFLTPMPPEAQRYIAVDIPSIARLILEDPQTVGEVFADFEDAPPPNRTHERYLTMVDRDIIGERYTVAWDGNTRKLTLRYTNSSVENAIGFLDAMVGTLGPEIATVVGPIFDDAVQSLDEALAETLDQFGAAVIAGIIGLEGTSAENDPTSLIAAVDRAGTTTVRSLADLNLAISRLGSLADDPTTLYSAVGKTAVFEGMSGTGRSTVVIIATITTFFLTVFLAFVLEYIRRVRHDPEEMEKLHSAWNRQ
ncbi:MAG: hypothetical protein WCY01_12975 [Alkalispirochaeta sp.]